MNKNNRQVWGPDYQWVVQDVKLIMDAMYSRKEFPSAQAILDRLREIYPDTDHLPEMKVDAFL